MSLLDLIFPPKCVLCGALLEKHQKDICPDCARDIWEVPRSHPKARFTDGQVALWYYEGNVRRSLLDFKFHNKRSYAKSYGRLLGQKLREQYPQGFDLLTWVPISARRKFNRGYDQSYLLAKAVGKELGMKPIRLLKKLRHNRPQSGISGDAHRRANVLGVYKATRPELLPGKAVLLLDDIITTGATLGECARILLTAGAKEIYCGAVACARPDTKTK